MFFLGRDSLKEPLCSPACSEDFGVDPGVQRLQGAADRPGRPDAHAVGPSQRDAAGRGHSVQFPPQDPGPRHQGQLSIGPKTQDEENELGPDFVSPLLFSSCTANRKGRGGREDGGGDFVHQPATAGAEGRHFPRRGTGARRRSQD